MKHSVMLTIASLLSILFMTWKPGNPGTDAGRIPLSGLEC